MKKFLISLVCVFAFLYVGGWYHAQNKCGYDGEYVFESDMKIMPPIYKQSFLQFSDNCKKL